MLKRGQTGQSLVILAIGFLALLGFVGIVTDVSVLFIRYSTMRRAVDAAAIAAAGQMRRVEDTKLTSLGIADGQATSVANLNLAARQFIEVYGLNPKKVIVETCGTQEIPRDANGNATDAAGHLLQIPDPGDAEKKIDNPAADPDTLKRYKELCTEDELKLVRVTAQIDAPTIFLRLLGYPTVTLTESAISQTAVIDVVMIFDVAESMANETTYTDWDNIPSQPSIHQGVYYMPAFIDPSYNPEGYQDISVKTQAQINSFIAPLAAPSVQDCSGPDGLYDPACYLKHRVVAFEPTTTLNTVPGAGSSDWQVWTGATTAGGVTRTQPREFCRVRGYLGSLTGGSIADDTLRQAYTDFFNNVYQNTYPGEDYAFMINDSNPSARTFRGFVPQYNYFGCCNDPLGIPDADGNYNFKDLICQPFKDARNAAHDFLDRLDFLRGDRIGFVTYNKFAYIVDPDGADKKDPVTGVITPGGPQGAMLESQSNIIDPADSSHTLRIGASQVLDTVIGISADGSGYADKNNDGKWDHLLDSGYAVTADTNDGVNDSYLMNKALGDITNNPVLRSCGMDNALVLADYLTDAKRTRIDGSQLLGGESLLDSVVTIPSWYSGSSFYVNYDVTKRSYEYRAGCASGNIGGALEAGSADLYNEGRREGSVWIMVLMSDGAAGASNPIYKYNDQEISPPDPYATGIGVDGQPHYTPLPGQFGPDTSPAIAGNAGYGFYGLCPYGTLNQPSQLLSNNRSDWYPFCVDLKPETRHFCGSVAVFPDIALDADHSPTTADANCFHYYNVDDFAHDWADWIGLADLNVGPGEVMGRVGDQLLPTIFTIGFGLNYDVLPGTTSHSLCSSTDYNCIRGIDTPAASLVARRNQRDRNSDYLGEELLRYIADVGDNNQIDTDYWQLCESVGVPYGTDPSYYPPCRDDGVPPPPNQVDRIPNAIDLTSSAPDWGGRGNCEVEYNSLSPDWNNRGKVYSPLPPQVPCGNYYVAANAQQLEAVFDQIASRVFTRLSQ